jgi:phenylacetate-CoA ligase
VPRLTKHDIIEHLDDLVADNVPAAALHDSMTGGTTGHVVYFKRDNASLPIKEAGIYRFEQWAGWDFGDWLGLVWPAVMDFPQKGGWRSHLRNRLATRRLLLPYLGEDRQEIRTFMAELVRRRVPLLRAFPGALASVARVVEEEDLPRPPLRSVISTGELLGPDQRALFERVFACPVLDSYRSREAGPVAQQCEELGGLHIAVDLCVVEIDTERGYPLTPDGLAYGPILFTDLHNYGMPLIRYELGDLGAFDPALCPCGRSLPLLREVGGRLTDTLFTIDRRPLAAVGMLPNILNHACKQGNQVQLVQRDYDDLLLRLTPPELDAETRALLDRRTEEVFGAGVRLSLEYVDEIPLLASGKFQLLHCAIPAAARPGAPA